MAELLGKFETLKRAGWKPLARTEFQIRKDRGFWCVAYDSEARAYAKVEYPFWAACEDFAPKIGKKAGVPVPTNQVFPFASLDRANCLCISPVIGDRQQSLGDFLRRPTPDAFDVVVQRLSALLPYLEFIGHNDVDHFENEKNVIIGFFDNPKPEVVPYPIDFEKLSISKYVPIKENWARAYGAAFSIDEEAYAHGVDGIAQLSDRFIERSVADSYKRFGLDEAPPPRTPSLETVIERLNKNKEAVLEQKHIVEPLTRRSMPMASAAPRNML